MAADRASTALGIELVAHGEGWAHARMTVTDRHTNGYDLAHGGLVFTLADTAFACACNSWDALTVAAGAEIVFVRGARAGDVLDARAQVRTRFGRHGVYDVTVTRGEGDDRVVVAEFRGHSTEPRPR